MERRKRLEQQRKDFPTLTPAVPDAQLGNVCQPWSTFLLRTVANPFLIIPAVDAAALLGDVSHLVPAILGQQDVICLDSSGEEDEKEEPKLPPLAIIDGEISLTSLSPWLQVSSETVTRSIMMQM